MSNGGKNNGVRKLPVDPKTSYWIFDKKQEIYILSKYLIFKYSWNISEHNISITRENNINFTVKRLGRNHLKQEI